MSRQAQSKQKLEMLVALQPAFFYYKKIVAPAVWYLSLGVAILYSSLQCFESHILL
jgi:hypothetical protein